MVFIYLLFSSVVETIFPEAGPLSLISLVGTVFLLCVSDLNVYSLFSFPPFPPSGMKSVFVHLLACSLKPVPSQYAFGLMLSA